MERPSDNSWFLVYIINIKEGKVGQTADVNELKAKTAAAVGLQADDAIIGRMEWLGLFSDEIVPANTKTYLDALCFLCKEKLVYAPGEQDMLVMRHEFVADYADRTETLSSTMIDFGIKNGTGCKLVNI
jgi:hypothetical protein